MTGMVLINECLCLDNHNHMPVITYFVTMQ
jgi:hypothetical protein